MDDPDLDKLILRTIFLQRFGRGFADKIKDLYKQPDVDLLRFVREWTEDATERDAAALMRADRAASEHVRNLFGEIRRLEKEQLQKVDGLLVKEMTDLIESEARYAAIALGDEDLARVKPKQILNSPVIGVQVRTTWHDNTRYWFKRVLARVTTAIQAGDNAAQALRGTKALQRRDGEIWTRDSRHARDAETHVQGVANNARSAVYRNAKVEREVFLETLDHRTCLRCINAADNGPYPTDAGPFPPIHNRCRCIRIPEPIDETWRPYVKDDRPVKNIPKSERPGKIGRTKFTYKEFFKRQAKAAQLKILGRSRYNLYRAGKYDVDEFVDDKTLKIVRVSDLDAL